MQHHDAPCAFMLRLLSTFLILFVGLWIATGMMAHVLEPCKDLNNMSHVELSQQFQDSESRLVNPCQSHELIQSLWQFAFLRRPLLLVFSHTVGRVWGTCRGAISTLESGVWCGT